MEVKGASTCEQLALNVNLRFQDMPADVKRIWEHIKSGLLNAVDKSHNDETWHNYILYKEFPKNI